MQAWKLQDAKARFSEMVNRAQFQPQQITRHGKPVGILMSPEDFAALQNGKPGLKLKADGVPFTFADHLLAMPQDDGEFEQIEFGPMREVDF